MESDRRRKDARIRELWLSRPAEKRCVIDVLIFEEVLQATQPDLLAGIDDCYKFLMQLLWEEIVDNS